jgi:hypothetical protein
MRGLLYIIAVILVIGWIFGFFFNHAGKSNSRIIGNSYYSIAIRSYQAGLINSRINKKAIGLSGGFFA